ncbi:ATP-dependent DNA helicase sgs1, partial [Ceratobasidium sp. 423]
DILAGKFQISISSIKAFMDTTRLLPIVKSPELAALGPQYFIIDEAHCIPKWGQHFRPQYMIVGTLRLLLTREIPMVTATVTANNLMRQVIKQSLRFGSNAFEVNLGNRRPNIVYLVHRLLNVSAVVAALLEYFHSKSELPGFTLIFVDSRKLGAQLLEALRQHVVPEIRGDIQLYHASRSEFDKKILAAGFERNDGFKAMFTTEALSLQFHCR